MSLQGVRSNTRVQAGEGSSQDKKNGGDGERGAAPKKYYGGRVTWNWRGTGCVHWTGAGVTGQREREAPRSLGSQVGNGDCPQDQTHSEV